MRAQEIVGWLIEPLDAKGEVITWIAHFPTFVSVLDAKDGNPPKYGKEFRVTPLVRATENPNEKEGE